MRPLGARGIQIHPGETRLGKPLREPPLQLLRTDAAHLGDRVTTGDATPGERRLIGAVVAAQRRRRLVYGQADAAGGAFGHMAAVRALQKGREAAPIEEEHPLLPPRQHSGDRRVQRFRPGDRSGPGDLGRGAQVHQFDRRQLPRPDPFRQPHEPEAFAVSGLRPAFQRRCGAPEHQAGPLEPGPHGRHLARVVPRRLAVLVRRLVFLVDHDDTRSHHRREDGRPRTYRDPALPAAQRPPGVGPLPVGEPAVQYRHVVAEHAPALDAPSAASGRSPAPG